MNTPPDFSPSPNGHSLTFDLDSVEKTLALGERVSRLLNGGDVVALTGDLGAGKTLMTKGIAKGLGIPEEHVNSPTFTLIQTYDSTIPVIHVDLYRLEDMTAIVQLGLDEYFTPQNIVIIEWADRLHQALPPDSLAIHLEHGETETSRKVTFQGIGPRSNHLVTALGRQNLQYHLALDA